jgi:calpain-7
MRQHAEKIPVDQADKHKVKSLLMDKARHYERLASDLMKEGASGGAGDDQERQDDDDDVDQAVDEMPVFSARSPLAGGQRSSFSTDETPFRSIAKGQSMRSVYERVDVNVERATNAARSLLSQAIDLDEQGKRTEAVGLYTQATDRFLHAIKICSRQGAVETKQRLEVLASQTMDRIEAIKHPKKAPTRGLNTSMGQTRAPSSDGSTLSPEEIDVLKQSSLIASGLFLPWSDQDAVDLANESARARGSFYKDPKGHLPLSDKQKEKFHCWARPSEILRLRRQHAPLGSVITPNHGTPTMIKHITPYSIQQKYVTDCSFIASLCICSTLERKFGKRLIRSIIYPQDERGEPMYNPYGKYLVKLWLNGVARCVVVDDFLPIDKKGNLLCSQTTNTDSNELELWVSIIEKAYMKLCGGYNFPGSNSGVDLFSLTGWIPERIHFAKDPTDVKDYETPADRAWERIFSANSYGDCLITVSTQSGIDRDEAEQIGLVTGHAYAVLSVIETTNGTRLLQLKNPWAHKGWKGRFSSSDKEGWRSVAFRTEVGYDPEQAGKTDDGVFFICWDDILKYFQNFHLSWNPELLSKRVTVHGRWRKEQGPEDDMFNVGENPQYTLSLSDAAIEKRRTLWILISRHVTKQEQEGKEATDFLTVHVHRNNEKRERVWYPGQAGNCVLTGCYTNNPHVLVRYDLQDASDKYLSLVLSQYQKSNDLNYTLSCFCSDYFDLGKPARDLPTNTPFSGTWSTYSAGGPIGSKDFLSNPQFAIELAKPSLLQIGVTTTRTCASNAILVPVRNFGDTADKAIGEAVIDSGKYRHGFVASDKVVVKAGSYALIVSNFHAGQTGLFDVSIASNLPSIRVQKLTK